MQASSSQYVQQLQDLQKKLSCDDPINIQFTSVIVVESICTLIAQGTFQSFNASALTKVVLIFFITFGHEAPILGTFILKNTKIARGKVLMSFSTSQVKLTKANIHSKNK